MICDDDHTITSSIKNLTNKISGELFITIESEITYNAVDCLYKIFKDYYNGLKYDILLIDETMPFMTGSCLTQLLKKISTSKELNNIKIYSITGYDDEIMLSNIKSHGCDGFIKKPVRYKDLKDTVESFIKQNSFEY